MNTTKQASSGLRAERQGVVVRRRNGFYHCSHCFNVVTPSPAQIELAENAPDADPSLKCPHCHKYAVHWRMPSSARVKNSPQPVSVEQGRELFAGIFRMLAAI
jgi:hypothetical protein